MSGGKYLLGDYDTRRDKFVVTAGGDLILARTLPPASTHRLQHLMARVESS